MKTYATAKIHGLRVTDRKLQYEGSISLPAAMMAALGIRELEQVHVNGYVSGEHWITYAILGPENRVQLNGPPAHRFELLEEIVVVRYELLRVAPSGIMVGRAGQGSGPDEFNRLLDVELLHG